MERDIKAGCRALWPASALGNKLMESELLFIKVAAIALITYPAVRLAMFKQFAYGRRKYLRMSASQQQQQPRLSLQIYGKHFAQPILNIQREREVFSQTMCMCILQTSRANSWHVSICYRRVLVAWEVVLSSRYFY